MRKGAHADELQRSSDRISSVMSQTHNGEKISQGISEKSGEAQTRRPDGGAVKQRAGAYKVDQKGALSAAGAALDETSRSCKNSPGRASSVGHRQA